MGRQVTSSITKAKISVKKILTEILKKKIYINHKSELHKHLKGFYPIEV